MDRVPILATPKENMVVHSYHTCTTGWILLIISVYHDGPTSKKTEQLLQHLSLHVLGIGFCSFARGLVLPSRRTAPRWCGRWCRGPASLLGVDPGMFQTVAGGSSIISALTITVRELQWIETLKLWYRGVPVGSYNALIAVAGLEDAGSLGSRGNLVFVQVVSCSRMF